MKRFTETQKWEDPWYRRLPPEMKLLWQWILDRCDNAGIIDPDIELASFQIGYQYPMDTLSTFGDRVIKIECGKYFVPKFIQFQYGTLSRECKAHKPIFLSLEKHEVKGYSKGIDTLQEKEKETEQEKETEEVPVKPPCTLAQARSYAPTVRLSPDEAAHWWHNRQRVGWVIASPHGGAPRKIGSWQSDMAASAGWVKEGYAKDNKADGKGRHTSKADSYGI